MIIKVKVTTNSKKESLQIVDNTYIVKFKAPREKGQANKKLISILAEHFNIPRSDIIIKSGISSTQKLIAINYPELGTRAFAKRETKSPSHS